MNDARDVSAAEQAARQAIDAAFPDVPEVKREALYQRWLDADAEARELALWQFRGYSDVPVDAETFLRDPYFLGLDEELYPTMIEPFVELNSGKYVEAVLTGGIGSAKTSLAVWTALRQLYELSLLVDPHRTFGLTRSDEIEFILQSITESLAEAVSYARLKALLDQNVKRGGYFAREFPYNKNKQSELLFRNRIKLVPVSGSNLATIGQNVIGGIIDELNYMHIVEASKRTPGVDPGVYNQAIEVYNSIARRRVSRFMKSGKLPGILCLVSSSKYPGQFTDKKIEERDAQMREKGRTTIYVYRKAVWDIKPNAFSSERFYVFEGDEFRKARVLAPGEKVAKVDERLVHAIPMDFREQFSADVVNALRELAGISHTAKNPFFPNKERLLSMFTAKRKSVFSGETTDFASHLIKLVGAHIRDRDIPRWAHVDLGLTGDSAGVAIGHCPGFVDVNKSGIVQRLPKIIIDGVLEVRPPPGDEINFDRIRNIFFVLRDKYGLNLKWITYDSWQSTDSVQILRQKGFITGQRSIDTDMMPADQFKSAVNDGRIECPPHEKLWQECKDVQIDFKKQKVDHLPNGSKDCFDAVCGVVYGLATRREVWFMYDVPIREEFVREVGRAEKKLKSAKPAPQVGDGWDSLRKQD